ncbi:general secretion pathway protein L [Undibacterium sp. GrIS 1.8]|uniref:type II secretion system protein GspL n=1 Tax=unclassified Undibacterium TaxID=2630295 RepID=UPI0033916539
MASTLYILSPSKIIGQNGSDWTTQARPFALVSNNGTIEQQGHQTLVQLKTMISMARQVVLLLAASDVSVLQAKVPPMSAAKLRQSLPNLLEDQLATDAADVILQSTMVVNGMCSVAVVDKNWMESLAKSMLLFGAKKISAYPVQMAMEHNSDSATVMYEQEGNMLEFAACSLDGNFLGLGLSVDEIAQRSDVNEKLDVELNTVLQTLKLFLSEDSVVVYLEPKKIEAYQQAIQKDIELAQRITLQPIQWKNRIAGLTPASPDLMAGVALANPSAIDLFAWRWPIGLAAAVLIINLIGINFEWFSLKREAQQLSSSLVQSYRAAYPKETVIIDPLAQMQQKISLSKKLAGQSVPDDFVVLAAQFSQIWDRISGASPGASVLSMEYREHSLFVKTRSFNQQDQLKAALQEQSLTLVSFKDGLLQVKTGLSLDAKNNTAASSGGLK